MAIVFDYSRPGRPVSWRGSGFPPARMARAAAAMMAAALVTGVSLPVAAQYAGKVPEQSKTNGPDLRAVAVLEWTGDPGHPKASRLVPITVWDGQELQDASIYMAQPEPLALQSEVEYKLKQGGKTIGYYDVSSAGQSQGTWVGFGTWKGLPAPKPAEAPKKIADFGEDDSGPPVLHRANHSDDSNGTPSAPAPTPDPNRPILREPPKPAADKPANPQSDVAYSQPIANLPDPDRPHLFHGKASDTGAPVLPTLAGLPPDMHQTIAVSDAANHPDHIWTYSWTNPDDAAKMKSDLEDLARKALAPPAPAAEKGTARRATRRTKASRSKAAASPPPLPLEDEQFHAFQLTYGGPATMVFSAHTQGGSGAQEKFITLIAQPDLYGNVLVLYKHITSADALDDDPAMKLINPVDAMADNRGELLFELRGATQREFALYRVVDGQVQKLFTSLPESVAMPAGAPPSN
jgi:hypothetical protein